MKSDACFLNTGFFLFFQLFNVKTLLYDLLRHFFVTVHGAEITVSPCIIAFTNIIISPDYQQSSSYWKLSPTSLAKY
jgi:hypothetical protein